MLNVAVDYVGVCLLMKLKEFLLLRLLIQLVD